jgi:hypothetical protein
MGASTSLPLVLAGWSTSMSLGCKSWVLMLVLYGFVAAKRST